MSELNSNIAQQKRSGYVLLTGAVATLIGGVLAFQYYDVPTVSYVGLLVPVVILGTFGVRAVSAGNSERAIGDERTQKLHGRVSINAFWWLVSILFIDSVFGVYPTEGTGLLYAATGLTVYVVYYGYYRYVQ